MASQASGFLSSGVSRPIGKAQAGYEESSQGMSTRPAIINELVAFDESTVTPPFSLWRMTLEEFEEECGNLQKI